MLKKFVLVALVWAAARFLAMKLKSTHAEQTLWAEATDSVPPQR